jgi:hypothetical protein
MRYQTARYLGQEWVLYHSRYLVDAVYINHVLYTILLCVFTLAFCSAFCFHCYYDEDFWLLTFSVFYVISTYRSTNEELYHVGIN